MLCEYAPLNFQTGADKSMMYRLNIQNLICIIIHLNVTCTINQNGQWYLTSSQQSLSLEIYESVLINWLHFWQHAKQLLLWFIKSLRSSLPLFLFVNRCVVPDLVVETPVLDFQRCFLDRPYEQQLRLVNASNVPACYGVLGQVNWITAVNDLFVCVCVCVYCMWKGSHRLVR